MVSSKNRSVDGLPRCLTTFRNHPHGETLRYAARLKPSDSDKVRAAINCSAITNVHYLFRYLNPKEKPGRETVSSFQCLVLLFVFSHGAFLHRHVAAQTKPAQAATSSLCSRENAVEMIKQQIDFTKTFNDGVRRINVLLRAADLLWPYQQDRARVVFLEAFELAKESERENEQKGSRSLLLRLQKPDQRYVVIRAVARKDAAWARELTQQLLKPNDENDAAAARSSFENLLIASRLLESAINLISSDTSAAMDFANASLRYPATSALNRFLFRLAELNQQAADQFYAQALAIYGDKPMREFLYLQAYPFALSETLNTPTFSLYQIPVKFVSNQSLQRQFIHVMLRRAQQALEVPFDEGDTYRNPQGIPVPGSVHLLQGLIRLQPQVSTSLPDLLPFLTQAREKILVSLSVENQKLLVQPGREISTAADPSFEEQIESAEKASDVNERDDLIANAVLSAGSQKQSLAAVIRAVEKISDSLLRTSLLEWLYFQRATIAIEDKRFDEAEKLAARVEGPELRAYLHIEMAKALLNSSATLTRGLQVLDEAMTEAKKAGATLFAARTLMTASHLYARIEPNRSVSVLAEAVNHINRIEAPDFLSDNQTLEKTPARRGRGGQYSGEYSLRFYMPGLDPENAFREIAKIDFDTSLAQSSSLTDKFQRSMSMLSVAEACLQQAPKVKPKKTVRS